MERVCARELVGKRVFTSDGVDIGELLDVELRVRDWQVMWIYIGLDRQVTDRFHVDAPFVTGTKAVALQPAHVKSVSAEAVQLRGVLEQVVLDVVVAFDTDAMRHIGKRGR